MNQLRLPFASEPTKSVKGDRIVLTTKVLEEFKENILHHRKYRIQKKSIKNMMLDGIELPKNPPLEMTLFKRKGYTFSWKKYLNNPSNTFRIITHERKEISSQEFYNRVMAEIRPHTQYVLQLFM